MIFQRVLTIVLLLLNFSIPSVVHADDTVSQYVTITGNGSEQGKYGPKTITVTPPSTGVTTIRPDTWQTIITTNADGKIFIFEPGIYENFSLGNAIRPGNVFLGKQGAILDGNSQIDTINTGVGSGSSPPANVQFINFTIRSYDGGQPFFYKTEVLGALNIGPGWKVIGNTFEQNHTALLAGHNWYFIDNAIIAHNTFRSNHRVGTLNGRTYLFAHNQVLENGWNYPDTTDQTQSLCWVGTLKFQTMQQGSTITRSNADNVVIKGNYIHHNRCHGIWLDVGAEKHSIIQNLSQYNEEGGITIEISNNNVVYANTAKHNGPSGWMYFGAQINTTDSSNTLVYGNIVEAASGKQGLAVNNSSGAHPEPAQNNQYKGNTIYASGGISGLYNESGAMAGVEGTIFDCNLYITAQTNSPIFQWNGQKTFSEFQRMGQEPNGRITNALQNDTRPTNCMQYITPAGYSAQYINPTATGTLSPTTSPTPTSTPAPYRFPSYTPTPTPQPITAFFTPPSWWNLLPEKLRNFLELLYIWTHYFQRQSDMKYLLDDILPTPTP